ncbi:MAG TPA: energy-coupling factor ABC transporter permease [Candidatus Limnocylindrales bacterium]|nr:energy-coupling factor ABC transporter permease [Candidatus Limnocylindrales bacterium]
MDLFAIATATPETGVVPALHAADRFLSVPVSLAFWAITIVVLGVAVRRTNRDLDEKAVPLMGVMAAFIFAAQMFNFQVAGGTSGHLLGGVLAAVLLGPWVGTLVMACVVAVQGLMFSDGGLLVMGANIFNMGIIGTLGGYAIYRSLAAVLGGEDKGRIPAAGVAAWVSVVAASVSMSLQLAISGTSPLEIVLPAMVGVHVFIGIGEALITVAALGFIAATRRDLFDLRPDRAALVAA